MGVFRPQTSDPAPSAADRLPESQCLGWAEAQNPAFTLRIYNPIPDTAKAT